MQTSPYGRYVPREVGEVLRRLRLRLAEHQCLFVPMEVCPEGHVDDDGDRIGGCHWTKPLRSIPLWVCEKCGHSHYCDLALPPVERTHFETCDLGLERHMWICRISGIIDGPEHADAQTYQQHMDQKQDLRYGWLDDEATALPDEELRDIDLADSWSRFMRSQFQSDTHVREVAIQCLTAATRTNRALREARRAQYWQDQAVAMDQVVARPSPPEEGAKMKRDAVVRAPRAFVRLRRAVQGGYTYRDAQYWDRIVFTEPRVRRYLDSLGTTVERARAVFKPRTTAMLAERQLTFPQSLWQQQQKNERRWPSTAYAKAMGRPIMDLVALSWLEETDLALQRTAFPATMRPALVDLLGRWCALMHITAPTHAYDGIMMAAAYARRMTATDLLVKDGTGIDWPILPVAPPCIAALFIEDVPPASPLTNGKKRKRAAPPIEDITLYITCKMEKRTIPWQQRDGKKTADVPSPRFTTTQVRNLADDMLKKFNPTYCAAPWVYEWFHAPHRQCWPPSLECT